MNYRGNFLFIVLFAIFSGIAANASNAAARPIFELRSSMVPADTGDTCDVAFGDVDGDGDLDAIFADWDSNNRLYLNVGTGEFTDVTDIQMPADEAWTTSVALGDVDGDGDLDIFFGNDQDMDSLYLNDGSGVFIDVSETHLPSLHPFTQSLVLGDVDGDGDLDALLGNCCGRPQTRLYMNDGSGYFSDVSDTHLPVDEDYTFAVALGDVDGDGDLDAVIGNDDLNRLYINDGTGAFTDSTYTHMPVEEDNTYAVALGDVDGDGDLDAVIGNKSEDQNRLYINDGTGHYTDGTDTRMPADSDTTKIVMLGDLDDDGDLDAFIGNLHEQNRVYLNDGAGTFTDATSSHLPTDQDYTNGVTMGDVDGDMDIDMYVGNTQSSQNRLYLNSGDGVFTDSAALYLPADADNSYDVALGDVDGDGDLDAVIGNISEDQNRLYINDGTGAFADATDTHLPIFHDSTTSIALGDVDGDADLDILFGNSWYEGNRLYMNDGDGVFSSAYFPTYDDQTTSIALGDVDGDGDLDALTGHTMVHPNKIYTNNGEGLFSDCPDCILPIPTFTEDVALVDVDGDEDLDAFMGIGTSTSYSHQDLFLNNGTGKFRYASFLLPEESYFTAALAFGDVDGDGDLDVFMAGREVGIYSVGQNHLYLNTGSGRFIDATATHMPPDSKQSYDVALGDVDGDGDLDAFVVNYMENCLLYLNDGHGDFTDVVEVPDSTNSAQALALGDVDGDGDLDAFVVGYGQSRLFYNTTFECRDMDEDGYGDPANPGCPFPELDCDDTNPAVNPGTDEICFNGIDDDCDELIDFYDPECEDTYTLELDAYHESSRLYLDFTLGTPVPAIWSTYFISLVFPTQVIPLWSVSLPTIMPPVSIPIDFYFPWIGSFFVYSGLSTSQGIQAYDLVWGLAGGMD